jgi:hypothetical protein
MHLHTQMRFLRLSGAVNEVPDSAGKGTSLDGKWLFLEETRADFGLYRL